MKKISSNHLMALSSLSVEINTEDVCHIEWELLGSVPTTWGRPVQIAANTIYMEERLLAIAWKIFQIPRKTFHFHFIGADPAHHPAFFSLLNYFSSVPRNVYVTLETNGSREHSWFVNLSHCYPEKFMRLALTLYPGKSDLKHVLLVIASVLENNQSVHVRLASSTSLQGSLILKALCGLREMLPFNAEFDTEESKSAFDTAALLCSKTGLTYFPILLPSARDRCANGLADPYLTRICAVGSSYLRILYDGSFYTSPCEGAPRNLPLWGYSLRRFWKALEEPLPCIKPHGKDLGRRRNFSLSRDSADQSGRERRINAHMFNCHLKPVINPLTPTPELADLIKTRIAGLACLPTSPNSSWKEEISFRSPSLVPVPGLIQGTFSLFMEIWSILSEENRDTLILLMLALENGNALYLDPLDNMKAQREAMDVVAIHALEPIHESLSLEIREAFKNGLTIQLYIKSKPGHLVCFLMNLLKAYPDTKLEVHSLASDDTGLVELALRALPARTATPAIQLAQCRATVLILVNNCKDTLGSTVDSIILQGKGQTHILLIDDHRSDEESEIARKCHDDYPELVRYLKIAHIPEKHDAINFALKLAASQYITFMDGQSIACNGFPLSILDRMDEEKADVALFKLLVESKDQIEPAEFWGGELLIPEGIIYRRDFLEKWNLQMLPGGKFGLDAFHMAALLYATNIVRADVLGCIVSLPTLSVSPHSLKDFLQAAQSLASLAHDFSSKLTCNHIKSWLNKCYRSEKYHLHASISLAARRKELENVILEVMHKPNVFSMILKEWLYDCASLYLIRRPDLPFKAGTRIPPHLRTIDHTLLLQEPGPASSQKTVVSIIFLVQNTGQLDTTLYALCAQSLRDFEVIVVAPDDKNRNNVLESLSQIDSRIRLYLCNKTTTQGAVCNFALSKSRGEFILFIREGEIPNPDFLLRGVESARDEELDMVIASYDIVDEKGTVTRSVYFPVGQLTYYRVARIALEEPDVLSLSAKLFRKKTIIASECQFDERPEALEEDFILQILRSDAKIGVFSSECTCISPENKYGNHTDNYATMRRAIAWFKFYQNIADEMDINKDTWEILCSRAKQVLEKDLLESLAALSLTRSKLPLSPRDRLELSSNFLFISTLLLECAQSTDNDLRKKLFIDPWKSRGEGNKQLITPVLSVILMADNISSGIDAAIENIVAQNIDGIEILYPIGSSIDRHQPQHLRPSCVMTTHIANSISNLDDLNAICASIQGEYVLLMDAKERFANGILLKGCAYLEANPDIEFVKFINRPLNLIKNEDDIEFTIVSQGVLPTTICRDGWELPTFNGIIFRRQFLASLDLKGPHSQTFMVLKIYGKVKKAAYIEAHNLMQLVEKRSSYILSPSLSEGLQNILDVESWLNSHEEHNYIGKEKLILEKMIDNNLRFTLANGFPKTPMAESGPFHLMELLGRPSLMCMLLGDAAKLNYLLHGEASLHSGVKVPTGFLEISATYSVESPALSIILVADEDADSFQRSLQSLFRINRSYTEIIVIDQQLNGENLGIVREAIGKNTTVRIFTANSPARLQNCLDFGIQMSRGEYVTFLKSGDIFDYSLLELCLDVARRNRGYDIIQFSSSYWNMERSEFLRRVQYEEGSCLTFHKILEKINQKDQELSHIWGKFYWRKSLALDKDLINYADRDGLSFLLAAYMRAGKVIFSALPAWKHAADKVWSNIKDISFFEQFQALQKTGKMFGEYSLAPEERQLIMDILSKRLYFNDLFNSIAKRGAGKEFVPSAEEVSWVISDSSILQAFLERYAALAREYEEAR